jgi:hypothetical protein
MDSPRITYISRPDATPEAELDALAACYRYVLFTSQERRGGQNDLTNNTTTKHLGKRTTERTETEKK